MPLLCNNTINVGLPSHDRTEMRLLFRLKLLPHQNNFASAAEAVPKTMTSRDPFVIPILTHHVLDDELLVSYAPAWRRPVKDMIGNASLGIDPEFLVGQDHSSSPGVRSSLSIHPPFSR